MNKKHIFVLILGIVTLVLLASCSPSAEELEKQGRAHVDAGDLEHFLELTSDAKLRVLAEQSLVELQGR